MLPERRPRKTIARYGRHGDSVRVFPDKKAGYYVVSYRDSAGAPHRRYFPLTTSGKDEACTWAESYHQARAGIEAKKTERKRLTLRELWKEYTSIEFEKQEDEGLRKATIDTYKYRWAKWMEFIGADSIVDETSLRDISLFIVSARKAGIVLNQVRNIINVARVVYAWGVTFDLVTVNKLAVFKWKQPKDVEEIEPAEYSTEEYEKLLRQLDPRNYRQWRAWVALMFFGHHGQRANAVLHLRWRDIDLDAGVINWPAKYQKQGKVVVHPLLPATWSALITAKIWRDHDLAGRSRPDRGAASYPSELEKSDWVIYAQQDKTKPYSYSAMHYQLMRAERKADVPHMDYRGGHGFRRMVFGNVLEATGDPMIAMNYIGDTDMKIVKSYDKRKQQRISTASATIAEGR